MDTRALLAEVEAAAAAYRRTKATHDKAQAALAEKVVAALNAGARPADVSRSSGWDREYNRRLKKKADEERPGAADSEPLAEHLAKEGGTPS